MTIIAQIKIDQFEARKMKDIVKSSLLTTLYSDIIKIGKDKRNGDSTEDEAISVIKKYIKSTDENLSLQLTEDKKSQFEIEKLILISYLPQQASEEELKEIIAANLGKSKGEIFKLLKEKFGSNYDAKFVNTLI